MSVRIFGGTRELAGIDPANRGLAYGDGLFETMRVHGGGIPLLQRHLARLREGASRLAIVLPDAGFLAARIAEAAAGADAGVLKLLLTRGEGGRGYAPSADADPTWVLSLYPLPASPVAGLRLHWCEMRLAPQPALAGIKHCNRLEQVLARAEVDAAGCDEGLVRDIAGNAISATSANLLVQRGDRWLTPPVEACGVAGVLRGWLLEQGLVEVAALSRADVETADALALCNAVRGILPVASLDARGWPLPTATEGLRAHLVQAYPAFARGQE